MLYRTTTTTNYYYYYNYFFNYIFGRVGVSFFSPFPFSFFFLIFFIFSLQFLTQFHPPPTPTMFFPIYMMTIEVSPVVLGSPIQSFGLRRDGSPHGFFIHCCSAPIFMSCPLNFVGFGSGTTYLVRNWIPGVVKVRFWTIEE